MGELDTVMGFAAEGSDGSTQEELKKSPRENQPVMKATQHANNIPR